MSGDLAAARHLAAALEGHRRRVERNGGAVPELVCALEQLARFRVSAGQCGSGFSDSESSLDDQGVTPRLLTYRQTGDALACSESTVKRLVASGDLNAVRIGGATRVRLADLDAYVADLGNRPAGRPA